MNANSAVIKVFVDTGGFLALADPKDNLHDSAVSFYRSLTPLTLRLTSWAVVSESYTWLRYHLDGPRARQWLDRIGEAEAQGNLHVVYPDPGLDRTSRRLIYRFYDQRISYVDALTLAILQARPDIDAIFAFDHHLKLSGIPVLPGPLT